jgi:hypothetical protein
VTAETFLAAPGTGAPLSSIDHLLGAGEHRFLSDGFRRVSQRIRELTVVSGPAGATVHATASVRYPADWSRKAAGPARRPHLSVVDGLVLATQLAEVLLTQLYALDDTQRGRMWLRRVVLRSGARPQEDLDAFAVSAGQATAAVSRTGSGTWVSPVEARIGTLRLHCELEHDAAVPGAERSERYASVDDLLGPAGQRYFGDLHRSRRSSVRDVLVDHDRQRIDAMLCLEPEPGAPHPTRGTATGYGPSVSVVDAATSVGQLSQALLYEIDGVGRAESNTMWMRRLVVDSAGPHQPIGAPLPACASVLRSRLIEAGGGTWRAVDLAGRVGGFEATYALAHRLPEPTGTHPPQETEQT